MKLIKTYQYRIKDSSHIEELRRMAGAVNFVWNYCNEWSQKSIQSSSKWLSEYDLCKLTSGCSAELRLHSQTVQAICKEYVTRRKQFKKVKLNWRSHKRQLGWIPFKSVGIKHTVIDTFTYCGIDFKVWYSQPIEGVIKSGSITEDARGRWYINLQCETVSRNRGKSGLDIGIDLGLKTTATCSDGTEINHAPYAKYEAKLAMAQRAKKTKLVKTITAKIKNTRKDYLHKETTKLTNKYDKIYVGNVSPKKLVKTRMAKSVLDNGWSMLKTMLEYKAVRLGVEYKEVNESFSTITCHICLNKTKQFGGLSGLGVREWDCEYCGHHHKRDVNAAQNILRTGHCAPQGIPLL